MAAKIAIYEPPKEGLPHLIVTFTSDGAVDVLTANSAVEARALVSERALKRRRERRTEELRTTLNGPVGIGPVESPQ